MQGVGSNTQLWANLPYAYPHTYQVAAQISDDWHAMAIASVQRQSLSQITYCARLAYQDTFFNHHISIITIGY